MAREQNASHEKQNQRTPTDIPKLKAKVENIEGRLDRLEKIVGGGESALADA